MTACSLHVAGQDSEREPNSQGQAHTKHIRWMYRPQREKGGQGHKQQQGSPDEGGYHTGTQAPIERDQQDNQNDQHPLKAKRRKALTQQGHRRYRREWQEERRHIAENGMRPRSFLLPFFLVESIPKSPPS